MRKNSCFGNAITKMALLGVDHPLSPYKLGTTICGSYFMVSRMWHPLINIML